MVEDHKNEKTIPSISAIISRFEYKSYSNIILLIFRFANLSQLGYIHFSKALFAYLNPNWKKGQIKSWFVIKRS